MTHWSDHIRQTVNPYAAVMLVLVVMACGGCALRPSPASTSTATHPNPSSWSVRERESIIEISYGRGAQVAQFAALHTKSGYFRLVFGPDSAWGTSAVLLPSFWSGGQYFQGAPITVTWKTDQDDLVLLFSGSVSTLHTSGEVRLTPPRHDSASARVSVTTTGAVSLDERSNEAFKPLMLSSMHVSAELWDTNAAFVGQRLFPIPTRAWILQPPISARTFGLRGGNSSWKLFAPTITIVLDEARAVTGWVTASNNPNDDNVGLWPATDEVLSSWSYTITATKPDNG